MPDIELGKDVYTKLNRISEIAEENPQAKFTTLAYLLNEGFLKACFYDLNRNAVAGIDKVHAIDYEKELDLNIAMLVQRLKQKKYRAQDIRRVNIPKPDGGQRPLGILVLEDKIVQRGVATLLNAIYEKDFLKCSYGFRAKLNCHEALKSVELMVMRGKTNYLLDMDIKGYFDTIDHKWLMKMLEVRIKDRTILHLIGKWLHVGVLEEGKRTITEIGTPQGGVISPLLANIYLHYVLDIWLIKKVSREMKGKIYLTRYADDFVIGCTDKEDALKLWKMIPERFSKFGLAISGEKSRMIEFGKKILGNGNKAESFDFLGFTHYMKYSRKGNACIGRKTIKKRMRRTLKAMNMKMKEWRNKMRLGMLYKKIKQILTGYYNYYGFAGNSRTLNTFHYYIENMWFKWINRRSQKRSYTWKEYKEMLRRYPLPVPKITRSYGWIYS